MTELFGIIGGGPAGLAAAYLLGKREHGSILFEMDCQVGGLSKTITYRGYRFDIGGHRFFTKNPQVESLWREVLPQGFLRRPRLSRIYYRRKFFDYPLKLSNALKGLGLGTSAQVMMSFARRRLFPKRPEASFGDWVSNRFGAGLHRLFFETYTEKLWGIPCDELSADWAAQRIRDLSLGRALLAALGVGRNRKVASLIEEFDYPRYGPGQLYESMAARAALMGADIRLNQRVTQVRHENGRIAALVAETSNGQTPQAVRGVISSMPLSELVLALTPPAPEEVRQAALRLRYRSIITVNLIVRRAKIAPDTWIYVHDPDVKTARVQLYKNWSRDMVPDPNHSSLGMEYFAFEHDALWRLGDGELVELAKDDLAKLGLVARDEIKDGFVARYAKAYPVYDGAYRQRTATIRAHLDGLANLACVGRYGQFRYNNMDHSILTGMLGVRRLLGEQVDPWSVNEEAEYHEINRA